MHRWLQHGAVPACVAACVSGEGRGVDCPWWFRAGFLEEVMSELSAETQKDVLKEPCLHPVTLLEVWLSPRRSQGGSCPDPGDHAVLGRRAQERAACHLSQSSPRAHEPPGPCPWGHRPPPSSHRSTVRSHTAWARVLAQHFLALSKMPDRPWPQFAHL